MADTTAMSNATLGVTRDFPNRPDVLAYWQSKGWVLVDPNVPQPPVFDPVLDGSVAGLLGNTSSQTAVTARAAFGSGGPSVATRSAVLRPFHMALASAYFQQCNIVTLGDSRMEGAVQSAIGRRYADRAAASLRARYGLPSGAATNFLPADFAGGIIHSGTTTGGFNNINLAYGLGKRARQCDPGSGAGTITWTFTGTSFKVKGVGIGPSNPTGTFSVKIDGGAAVTVDTSAATSSSSAVDGLTFYTSSALTAGSHTVVVTWVSGYVFIDGIEVYNGDEAKGLRLYDGGHSGLASSDYANMSGHLWPQAYAAVNPHLLLLELGANDQGANIAPATFQTNLTTIIAAVRNAASNPTLPVVVIAGGARTDNTFTHAWSEYVAAMAAAVAADSHALLFDGTQRFPDGTDTAFYADQLHETDAGHAAHGAALAQFLLPV